MGDVAIRAEGLSKQYRIGSLSPRYGRLTESLWNGIRAPFRRFGRDEAAHRRGAEYIWALKDLSFTVREGEAVGIIGRNGAGKTTVLKILSRITDPTEGFAEIYGRVGSLLEVGTGFHQELTGRENIYLNGAILGMRRKEIDRKFDEIVEFAGVERFIDTPVKRYSSGMNVRLAFSVAAHLEPEILLVDEVLAVGDMAFQKRSLGKMDEVSQSGRTVVFVSHDMGAITSLTKRCLYLSEGRCRAIGETSRIVQRYFDEAASPTAVDAGPLDSYRRSPADDAPIVVSGISCPASKHGYVEMGGVVDLRITLEARDPVEGANLTLIIKDAWGRRLAVLFSPDYGFSLSMSPGQQTLRVSVADLPLSAGRYFVDVGVNQSAKTKAFDTITDFPAFEVVNNGQLLHWVDRPQAALQPRQVDWRWS